MFRMALILSCLALVAACQTVPDRLGFSARQVAVMTQAGFRQVDSHFELGLADRMLFEVDSSVLQADQVTRLNQLAGALRGVGIDSARVEGNTDSTGTSEYNLALSQRRALAVKQAMVSGGMAETAIQAVGLGETNPLASNDTDEGRQQNRRVVIIISPEDAS